MAKFLAIHSLTMIGIGLIVILGQGHYSEAIDWSSFSISNWFNLTPTTTSRPAPRSTYRTTRSPIQTSSQGLCSCAPDSGSGPLCASNGITYVSLCRFQCAKQRVPRLRVVRNGSCSISLSRGDYWGRK